MISWLLLSCANRLAISAPCVRLHNACGAFDRTSLPLPNQLRLFDVDTFDTQILSGHTASILSVDTSPDGQFVATASKDSTARCVCAKVVAV